MVEHLDNRCFTDRACLEVFHSVFTRESNRLNFRDKVGPDRWLSLLYDGLLLGLSKVDHVAHKNFDRHITLFALLNPLLDFFKA